MTDREEGLAALRESIGGVDPVLDQAASYAGAVKEIQRTVRQQGQVMSATLANNHTLYHTNKKLVPENRALRAELATKNTRIAQLEAQLAELQQTLADPKDGGYKALYQKVIKTLNAYIYDLLDTDQLTKRLEDMKAQALEIEALPEKATPLEIARGEYSDPYHPEAQAQAMRERMEADRLNER